MWPFTKKRSAELPKSDGDWIDSGDRRWHTTKENCGWKRQTKQKREINLDNCADRWVDITTYNPSWPGYGQPIAITETRLVRSEVSDEVEKPVMTFGPLTPVVPAQRTTRKRKST